MHAAPRGRYDFPPAITADSRPDVTSPSRFLFWLIRSYGWVVPAMTLSAASCWARRPVDMLDHRSDSRVARGG